MNFRKFNSIENSYRKKYLDKISIIFPKERYMVLEKIHGANFSFHVTEDDIVCGKRTSLLTEEEMPSFFNSDIVFNRYKEKMRFLFNDLKEYGYENLSKIIVYGEIFGGNYPHEDVEKLPVTKVQKKVYYNNDVDFITFDVFIETDEKSEYLTYQSVINRCRASEIPYLPILFSGTLQECLEYPNTYQTTIPERYGLPAIENNICEGNIIKPFNDLKIAESRVILKNKNANFTEKSKEVKAKIAKQFPEELLPLRDTALQYINDNRLHNVISKVGSVAQNEFGKLVGLFVKDIVEDFSKENPEFLELDKDDRKKINKSINGHAANFIRPNFVNILDGEY